LVADTQQQCHPATECNKPEDLHPNINAVELQIPETEDLVKKGTNSDQTA
jgi:hypothetical protein